MAKMTLDDLDHFSRELAHLTQSGAPLPEGLKSFSNSMRRGRLKTVSAEAAQSMQRGKSLSQSLEETSVGVPPEFIHLVRSGETSGDLGSILTFAADQARRVKRHRAALATAFSYPIFVLITVALVFYLFSKTLMPKFADIYLQLGAAQLPPVTQFILDVGYFFRGTSGSILGVGLIGLFLLQFMPEMRDRHYRLMLKVPGMSLLATLSDTSAAMRTLSSMLSRGVPMSDALRTSKLVVWDADFRHSLEEMAVAAEQGHATGEHFSQKAPPTAAWLYGEAERRGDLAQACDGIARYCEEWFDRISVRSIAIVEPLLIVILGVLMGVLIISMYLPLFMIPKVMGMQG